MNLTITTPSEDNDDDYSGSSAENRRNLVIPLDAAGQRLDSTLAALLPEYSRSRLQAWIRAGQVRLSGETCTDVKCRLAGAEQLEIVVEADPETLPDEPEDIPLDIIYEDEHILVINKPAGLVVHPGSGNHSGTLLNGLLAHDLAAADLPRAGIVHRLDKDTSGLMVVARTLVAQTDLVRQLQARTVKRHYAAVVVSNPPESGTVDKAIDRHPTLRTRMAVIPGGREARTHFRVVERLQGATWIECILDTGRTHQIRVHMAHLGYPLIGDPVYGAKRRQPVAAAYFTRQALHAYELGLIHPVTRRSLSWRVDLPDDLAELIERLR